MAETLPFNADDLRKRLLMIMERISLQANYI